MHALLPQLVMLFIALVAPLQLCAAQDSAYSQFNDNGFRAGAAGLRYSMPNRLTGGEKLILVRRKAMRKPRDAASQRSYQRGQFCSGSGPGAQWAS